MKIQKTWSNIYKLDSIGPTSSCQIFNSDSELQYQNKDLIDLIKEIEDEHIQIKKELEYLKKNHKKIHIICGLNVETTVNARSCSSKEGSVTFGQTNT